MKIPRGWFQIHLSTALFLMLEAAFIVLANLQGLLQGIPNVRREVGIPFPAAWTHSDYNPLTNAYDTRWATSVENIALDILFALVLLIPSWAALEWSSRRFRNTKKV